MDEQLERIIDACLNRQRAIDTELPDLTLRMMRDFRQTDASAIRELVNFARKNLGIVLQPVGGGFGCADFNFTIAAMSKFDRLRKLWQLLHDDDFLDRASNAGFQSVLTRAPRNGVYLPTREVYGTINKPAAKIFCSYSHQDRELQLKLRAHFEPLRLAGFATVWYDGEIQPGGEFAREIEQNLQDAAVILLLISSDFFASEYIMENEVPIAIARHDRGETHAVPIILRPVYWKVTSLGRLKALPLDGVPVTEWHAGVDAAMSHVAENVHLLLLHD